MENLKHDIKTVLITREQIAKRVREMGQQITKDYAGKEIVLVGILKGAMPFLCDLMREIDLRSFWIPWSFPADATTSSGLVKIKKDLDSNIRGRHVIVVEDIIDTGITMAALTPILEKRGAASVELAIFLDKRERREKEVNVKYIGYEIPDKFIVGYGCDYAQKYRNLPEICELDNKVFAQAK